MAIKPSDALIKFHREFCPDVPINSPTVIYRLLEKLGEKARKKGRWFFGSVGC